MAFLDKFARRLGVLEYLGTWNASTNTPSLASGVGQRGGYYIVSVAGSTNLDGINGWDPGDWAIFNGTTWEKLDNTDLVTSVASKTGAVALEADDISDFDARVIALTTGMTIQVDGGTPSSTYTVSQKISGGSP